MTRPLRSLPKAHLHLHLDGSYPIEAVERLARRRGVGFSRPAAFATVWEFFDAYGTVPALVSCHEDLAELCRAVVVQEAAEGVLYAEPAVEPQLYAPRLGSLEQVMRTVLAAFAEASTDHHVQFGLMLTVNTDQDAPMAGELAALAASFAGHGVTALGTAGFEEPADLRPFASAIARARAAGLPIVSHAGQTGGPDSVRAVLDEVSPSRLSHGFRAAQDAELVARLAAEGIVCDVCPVSNVALGVVADLAHHPAPQLAAAGVPVTLAADDQLWFGAGITDQYQVARDVWGLSDRAIASFARAGRRATGMSEGTRTALDVGIDAWLQGDPR